MNNTNILLRHNYVPLMSEKDEAAPVESIATIMMNLSYYGYALNEKSYASLRKMSELSLSSWWLSVETELKSITGDDRNIGDFVVYKNFPTEVLDKSEAEYWLPQILMYWGFPSDLFTEEVKDRLVSKETKKAKVLQIERKDTVQNIFNSYLASPARWKSQELKDVLYLSDSLPCNVGKIGFKENLVSLATHFIKNDKKINLKTGTDVLRLAAGLSDGDVSLREKFKFKSFNKPTRRFILSSLERCNNLSEDIARRPELWKKFLRNLHAGDYKKKFPNVCKAMDDLYNDRLETFNSGVEAFIKASDPEVLNLLSTRPGDFKRRLVHMVDLFGTKAVNAFTSEMVLSKLTSAQIVTLRSHLETVNARSSRVFPPKGNWNKLQVADPRYINESFAKAINLALDAALAKRMPKIKFLDDATKLIKLPNNGEVSPYARGTIFTIPKGTNFIRTASYWKNNPSSNTWFDNSWNFFDSDWKSIGECCWNIPNFTGKGHDNSNYWNKPAKVIKLAGAIFSGDPVNSGEMKGRAAQLIDLYPSKLIESGVRYAVWSILCFSNVPFAKAEDVFAALQWGEDATSGKLFEPSRCQLAFPLTGDQLTKYVCCIDLQTNQMTYLDANLHGNVRSANMNGISLEKNLPPFMEYLDSLPSVHDLFRKSVDKKGSIHVLSSDEGIELNDADALAYVFNPLNKSNKFKPLDLNDLLT